MSHHVACMLPDGRRAVAEYRRPEARVIRRVNKLAGMKLPGDAADYAALERWLDERPGEACTYEQVIAGTCDHPEASA